MASNKRFLKAYARFDGSGRIVPSSTILRKNKPKVGSWKEVQTYLCCNYEPVPFISVWRTTVSNRTVFLPYDPSGTYSGTINWGDGTTSDNSYGNRVHLYTTAGDHTITITGTTIGFSFSFDSNSRSQIRSVTQWGDLQLGNSTNYFYQCNNLDLSGVIDILNLSDTTNLTRMFSNCTSLIAVGRINEWDVSSVSDMTEMFYNDSSFNQNIGSWNVSNVVTMEGMFVSTEVFNQDISSWDVSSVTNMNGMFDGAISFNQNLSSWCVSLIPSTPTQFSTGASAWVLPKPVWGTCP